MEPAVPSPAAGFSSRESLDAASRCSSDPDVVRAVTMAVVGSAEMAGHLSRWDRFYLKSYESMAGHRFNLTTLVVEPNVWGTVASGRGTVLRRLAQLVKAAEWLKEQTGRQLHVEGPIKADRADHTHGGVGRSSRRRQQRAPAIADRTLSISF